MATTYRSMLNAAQLQHIVRYIQEDKTILNERNLDFQTRKNLAQKKLDRELQVLLPDEIYDDVSQAITEYCCELADIMLAFGMKIGARLEVQLLFEDTKDLSVEDGVII